MKQIIYLVLLIGTTTLQANSVDEMLASFKAAGAGPFSAEQGRKAWEQTMPDKKSGKPRSCTNCHGDDLSKPGSHIKTGKPIEPMAPSVNPKRLSDTKKIRKWLKRNCKWTWGRECTPQEKGDLLLFLQQK